MELSIEKVRNFAYGVVLLISFLGALYGSFKPETDALASHNSLAPIVDQTTDILPDINNRLIYLEGEMSVLKDFVVNSQCAVKKTSLPLSPNNAKVPMPVPQPRMIDNNLRTKDKPSPMIQQRQKTRWEK